jgi:hypothetical protein
MATITQDGLTALGVVTEPVDFGHAGIVERALYVPLSLLAPLSTSW